MLPGSTQQDLAAAIRLLCPIFLGCEWLLDLLFFDGFSTQAEAMMEGC